MYSGSTLTNASGRFIGAHQKIDRLAEKQLYQILGNDKQFPPVNKILHFEGCNGPDGIKRKSPAQDEPKHFIRPYDNKDTELIEIIESHFKRLVASIRQKDEVRIAFEAAWLSHALVDGLTPAHQYPYEEKLSELRDGQGLETRNSPKEKLMMPGSTFSKQLSNNWKFWGPKGLFLTHAAFEMGIATMIKPMQFNKSLCQGDDMFLVTSQNIGSWFRETAQEVAKMNMYEEFYKNGWTRNLAIEIKKYLIPIIVRTVTLAWYGAIQQAELAE